MSDFQILNKDISDNFVNVLLKDIVYVQYAHLHVSEKLVLFSVGSHVFSTELYAPMTDMYDEGDWGSYDTCPTGSYAAGIQLKVSIKMLLTDRHMLWTKPMISQIPL